MPGCMGKQRKQPAGKRSGTRVRCSLEPVGAAQVGIIPSWPLNPRPWHILCLSCSLEPVLHKVHLSAQHVHQRSRVHQDLRVWDMGQHIKGGLGRQVGSESSMGWGGKWGSESQAAESSGRAVLSLQGQLRTAPCMRRQLQQKW